MTTISRKAAEALRINETMLEDPAPETTRTGRLIAWCSSTKCAGRTPGARKEKNVPFSADQCPNCGHYLFWEREAIYYGKEPT